MKCKYCQSENLEVMKKGPHWELFCADCLTFQTFLNGREYLRFQFMKEKISRKKIEEERPPEKRLNKV